MTTDDLRALLIALANDADVGARYGNGSLSADDLRTLALAAAQMALETALRDCETGAQRWPVMCARIRALAAGLDK